MISWNDVNTLQKQQLDLQITLSELIKNNASIDEISAIKSELLYISKQLEKIIGSNEINRQKELRAIKNNTEQININNFNAFKDKYKKICKMSVATNHMIYLIDSYYSRLNKEYDNGISKIKAA